MRTLICRFAADSRAAVAIVSSFALAGSLALVGIVTDTALIYLHKRSAQSATDLAALVAARSLAEPRTVAARTLADNGLDAPAHLDVVTGRYEADGGLAPQLRFTPGASPANAVRVRAVSQAPVVLWSILNGGGGPQLVTEAVAVNTGVASFAAGSRLASLEGGVLNALLGSLLDGAVTLHVMDYRALADARIDMFALFDRLALDLGVAGNGFADLLGLDVGLGTVARAAAGVLESTSGNGSAVRALRDVAAVGGPDVQLGELFDPGPFAASGAAAGSPGLSAVVSAFDLVFAAARLADRERAAHVRTGLSVPGLVDLTLDLAIGEPAQGTSWVAVGEAGARVSTAQTRILLKAGVGGSGLLAGARLSVPIYAEVAAGTAELAQVSCGMWSPGAVEVRVAARPGIASLWLADIDEAALPRFGSDARPRAAHVVTTALARVEARAHVEMAQPQARELVFTRHDIDAGAVKTVRTDAFAGPAVASLLSQSSIDVRLLGLGLGLPGAIGSLVGNLLAGAAAPLDAVLAALLRAAGVGLGELDVAVGGVRCDGSALVM